MKACEPRSANDRMGGALREVAAQSIRRARLHGAWASGLLLRQRGPARSEYPPANAFQDRSSATISMLRRDDMAVGRL